MRAYHDWVMVEEVKDDITESGLQIVQDDMEVKILKAKVLSVGQSVNADIAEGDTVVCDRYAGSAFKDRIFVRESEIHALITQDS